MVSLIFLKAQLVSQTLVEQSIEFKNYDKRPYVDLIGPEGYTIYTFYVLK